MAELRMKSKQVRISCSQCQETSLVQIHREGLHAFICPYCGQPHLLLVDANLGLRDFRPVSNVPARKPFDIARIRVKDETLVPSHLKPFLDAIRRGVLPPRVEEALELLRELDLLEVEE
ncbi:MAG: hypothetical protein QW189_04270 [Thermofilaceae archaeon]